MQQILIPKFGSQLASPPIAHLARSQQRTASMNCEGEFIFAQLQKAAESKKLHTLTSPASTVNPTVADIFQPGKWQPLCRCCCCCCCCSVCCVSQMLLLLFHAIILQYDYYASSRVLTLSRFVACQVQGVRWRQKVFAFFPYPFSFFFFSGRRLAEVLHTFVN